MNTIAAKFLTLGIMTALGGFGLVAGPAVSERLPTFADPPSATEAPTMVTVTEVIEDKPAVPATDLQIVSVEAAPPIEALARRTSEPGRAARELAHERRDAFAAVRTSARAAREAALARPEPGSERGLDAEHRAAARSIGIARREALHGLNATHREAVRTLAQNARDANDDAAPGHGQRGRSNRATHGR